MTLLKIIIALTALIHLSTAEKDVLFIVLNVPNFNDEIFDVVKSPQSFRSSLSSSELIDKANEDNHSTQVDYNVSKEAEENATNYSRRYEYLRLMFPELFSIKNMKKMRRMEANRPLVEMAPGTIKTEMVMYPPNYLEDRLKYLLKLKKKQKENDN